MWALLVPTVVFGVAQSLNLPNSFSLLTAAAPKENRGAFLSLNSTILRLGQTVGPVSMSAAATGLGLVGAYVAAMSLLALVLIRQKPVGAPVVPSALRGPRRWPLPNGTAEPASP